MSALREWGGSVWCLCLISCVLRLFLKGPDFCPLGTFAIYAYLPLVRDAEFRGVFPASCPVWCSAVPFLKRDAEFRAVFPASCPVWCSAVPFPKRDAAFLAVFPASCPVWCSVVPFLKRNAEFRAVFPASCLGRVFCCVVPCRDA